MTTSLTRSLSRWTLALALHTAGVLGRLFAEALENTPTAPAEAIRLQGGSQVAASPSRLGADDLAALARPPHFGFCTEGGCR